MSSIELRPATADDYEFAYRVHRAAMRESVEQTYGWDEAWQREYFRERFDAPRQVVRHNGVDVGVFSVADRGETLFLSLIAILPEYQGRGIGTTLIRGLQRRAKARGATVTLQVLKVNRARALYERLGFAFTGETETHYQMRWSADSIEEPRPLRSITDEEVSSSDHRPGGPVRKTSDRRKTENGMMPTEEKRTITPEDLYRFQLVTECRISPDGEHVVFSVQRVDEESEKKYGNLWLVPGAGDEAPRQFTRGDHTDTKPRWSPNGNRIAFLSNRVDEDQPQIHVIPFAGGEARQLSDMEGEFGTLEWSPDGQQLLCQFRKKDQEAVEREQDEQKKELGVVSRRIERVFYKLDGEGFLPKERWHVWIIDAESGDATQLTEGEVYDELDPRWSPDGEWIVFHSNRADDPDLDPDAVDIFVMSAEGGDAYRLDTPVGPKEKPVFSPDGKQVAYLGHEGRGDWWKNTKLWIVPVDGSSEARNLTGRFDIAVSCATINDLPGGLPMSPPTWSLDGDRITVQVSRRGSTALHSVSLSGEDESLHTIVGGEGVIGSFSLSDDHSVLAFLRADMKEPAEVWTCKLPDGEPTRRSHVNEALLREIDLGEVEEVWFKGAAGNDLQGWILRPPGFDPSQVYPAIVEIHGGPRTQYGHFFMHEFYVLAAQGYVVAFCNPRGSRGYGEEHARAIWNRWGSVDYADLMAWADFVAEKPTVDSERMGVTGGSYGGYMTNWIIGHTDRFQAAVTQRSVSNLISMYGSSDFNWSFQQEFGDQPPWEALESYWEQSPISHIGNAATPTLVIHSENDLRCPIEQGEQVFVALKKLGVDTEMIRFPDEPHGLSRGGRTDRRVERLEHILRWFERHLKEDET